jgi:hypothetical protein
MIQMEIAHTAGRFAVANCTAPVLSVEHGVERFVI